MTRIAMIGVTCYLLGKLLAGGIGDISLPDLSGLWDAIHLSTRASVSSVVDDNSPRYPRAGVFRTVRSNDSTFHEIPRGCVDTESRTFTPLSARCR
jgi:hypothetical protein